LELSAWVAAVGVVVTMAAYLVAQNNDRASWVLANPPANEPVVPNYPSASPASACIFDSCASPGPSGAPTRVRIPAIGVDSTLENLRLDAARHLVPPASYTEAGWYADGFAPGDRGPAVIAGHVDSYQGPGVFFRLYQLKPGDVIEVLRGTTTVAFTVTLVEQYPKNQFPTDKVYRPTPDAQLRVITCGGDFDQRSLTYRDNIVVYAIAGGSSRPQG
jgi:sortase (surface protein transpeptidase)